MFANNRSVALLISYSIHTVETPEEEKSDENE